MLWLLASALAADPWAIVAPDAPLYAHAGDTAPVGAVADRLGALWQVASIQDGWVQLRTRVAPSQGDTGMRAPAIGSKFPLSQGDGE